MSSPYMAAPAQPPHFPARVERRSIVPWFGFGSAVVAFLMAFVPFSAGLAWLPALVAIVLGVVGLAMKMRPLWPSIVAVSLGPLAWLLAILVTLGSWALSLAAQADDARVPRPEPAVVATTAPSSPPTQEPEPSASTPAVPTASEPPAETAETMPGIGETILVDDWAITVLSVGARTAVAGDSTWGAEAQGEFVPVYFRVENRGTVAEAFWPDDVVAVDGQMREFSYSSEASIWADDSLDWYDEINPGNVVEGAIYFDVPEGTALERVAIDVGWFSERAEIRLN